MSNSLNSVVKNATKWSTLTEVVVKLLSPVINMILARILAPEAFGVVATITMVTSFADVFTDAGFQKYLIQHEFENEEDLNNSTTVAFWTNFGISAFLYVLIAVNSNRIAGMLGNASLGNGIKLAGLTLLMTSFSSIQMARYRRSFDFKTLFYVRLLSSALPFVVTIPLALIYKNYWALLMGILASGLFNAVVLTVKSPWKPAFYYSRAKLKEMFSFSFWSLLEAVSIWITTYAGTFIVGYYLNDYYLGLYKITITTVNSYMAIITGSTTTVLFSALSRLKDNEKEFQNTFFQFQRLVSMFVMPMGVGLLLYRRLATRILLGPQWSETADFIGLWALMSAVTIVFGHYNSEIFRSKGKPKLSLLAQILHLMVLVPVLMICSRMSFQVLYVARSLVRLHMILVGQIILWLAFKISFIKIFKNVLPTICASFCMGCVGFLLKQLNPSVLWEGITVLICIFVYFGVILSIPSMRKELSELKGVRRIMEKVNWPGRERRQ